MSTSITTRQTAGTGATVKGSPLSNIEVDNNFIKLNQATQPAGGTVGQILVKIDSTDFNSQWSSLTTVLGYTPVNKAGDTVTGTLNINFANATYSTPVSFTNTTAGGGQFSVALFAGSVGSAVAGDSLIANNIGNMIISPNASGKSLKLVGGTWTGAAGITIDGSNNVAISSGATIGGSTALHAGNYNSYAPTLTGTGASGTWGINVTGSAGSLSSNSSYLYSRGSVDNSALNSATSNGFYVVGYTGSSSSLLTWNAGGSTGPVQIEFFYPGNARFRSQTDSSSWQAWKTFVTDANYSSYALPLTGGTVTGTIGSNRDDLGRIIASFNTSAGGAAQFFIDHSYGDVNIGNARGGVLIQGYTALHTGNYNSYALPLGGGTMTGSIKMGASGYNFPDAITAGADPNWAFGFASDNSSYYYPQVKFYGTGSNSRGFRVLNSANGLTAFFANELGASVNGNTVLHSGNWTSYINSAQFIGTAATKAISYNANSISENITIASGQNAYSAGPITVNDGYTVTIADGGVWVVI